MDLIDWQAIISILRQELEWRRLKMINVISILLFLLPFFSEFSCHSELSFKSDSSFIKIELTAINGNDV